MCVRDARAERSRRADVRDAAIRAVAWAGRWQLIQPDDIRSLRTGDVYPLQTEAGLGFVVVVRSPVSMRFMLPAGTGMAASLEAYLDERGGAEGYLFRASSPLEPLSESTIRRALIRRGDPYTVVHPQGIGDAQSG